MLAPINMGPIESTAQYTRNRLSIRRLRRTSHILLNACSMVAISMIAIISNTTELTPVRSAALLLNSAR